MKTATESCFVSTTTFCWYTDIDVTCLQFYFRVYFYYTLGFWCKTFQSCDLDLCLKNDGTKAVLRTNNVLLLILQFWSRDNLRFNLISLADIQTTVTVVCVFVVFHVCGEVRGRHWKLVLQPAGRWRPHEVPLCWQIFEWQRPEYELFSCLTVIM